MPPLSTVSDRMWSHPDFMTGMRLGATAILPIFFIGMAFGAEATLQRWPPWLTTAFSGLAFTGSAQVTLLAAMSTGPMVAAVVAAVLMNSRYVMMSLALNDSLRGGRLRRAAHAQALVDASFAIGHDGTGRFNIPRLIGASVPQWFAWTGGTALGAFASPSTDVMRLLGLDAAFAVFFLVLAIEEIRRSRSAAVAAVVSAVMALLVVGIGEPEYAVLAASAATLIGVHRRSSASIRS